MTFLQKAMRNKGALALAAKYIFSLLITVLACAVCGSWSVLPVGVLELAMVFLISSLALSFCAPAGHILHFILYLLYNAQMLLLLFGNSYVTMVMLTNLDMINDLQGNFGIYALGVVPFLALLCIPLKKALFSRKTLAVGLCLSAACWGALMLAGYTARSPFFSLGALVREEVEFQQAMHAVDADQVDPAAYRRDGISDYTAKPAALPEQPNIILVICEGLSQDVAADARGLMPNLQALEQESLRFTNYYNHTFATFRGIIGQLFSGHQLSNYDANRLASLQSILRGQGYSTAFINTEPILAPFTQYLENLGFDTVVTDPALITEGMDYVTDKTAYTVLMDTAQQMHAQEKPFFLSMYTFQTHVSLDSGDAVFGDGGMAELNKFHNTDVQLGAFLERFMQSDLRDDTVLVFTADHATYVDADYLRAFPGHSRAHSELSDIPLVIWHRDIQPQVIDAGGRNSLDLAPTLLDYLDISAENYFMGDSLFCDAEQSQSAYDTLFFDGTLTASTRGAQISDLSVEQKQQFLRGLAGYFSLSSGGSLSDTTLGLDIREFSAVLSEDHTAMTITFSTLRTGDYRVAVWGEIDAQNDLEWQTAKHMGDKTYSVTIDLTAHAEIGEYAIHIYELARGEMSPILFTSAYVAENAGYSPAP